LSVALDRCKGRLPFEGGFLGEGEIFCEEDM
jgi:hypothetical protein